ncbi:MAG TPA: di-heme oxidoredictase family protein [Candidatus Saccharimonadales bacterium]|jgi:CxxC motif-containing protein (DUF1111 family)|nr:di-heme oxidoredictase family protein [Candidatus Saccharimonadales bacterium]
MSQLAKKIVSSCVLAAAMLLIATALQAQTDPGPRPVGTLPAVGRTFCPDTVFRAKFPGQPACVDTVQPPNGTSPGAGDIIAGGGNLAGFWFRGLAVFEAEAAVPGSPQTGGANLPGLGPSFNEVSCFECHSQPAVGGTSPNKLTPNFGGTFFPGNPQIDDAPTAAQLTGVSDFIRVDGPVREARFVSAVPPATPNTAAVGAGSVAELFVIQGRTDAPTGCVIDQEPFHDQFTKGNVIFRIPTPTFGLGFVEAVPEENLVANLNSEDAVANNINLFNPTLGIAGRFNHNGNDGTITRFGWKAQNKSLLLFAGEAANVELGVTNEIFQNERTVGNGQCTPNKLPEDQAVVPPTSDDVRTITDILTPLGPNGVASDMNSSIENFAVFMRLNAAPNICNYNSGTDAPNGTGHALCNTLDASALHGKQLFGTVDPSAAPAATTGTRSIGCVFCHTDVLSTGPSQTPGLSHQTFHPFSDFAIHHMGGLADGVIQGDADIDEFRTAPLWGLGQRLFFLHDGRHPDPTDTTDPLVQTILDHCLPPPPGVLFNSEACGTVNRFSALSISDKQDILNFLRSL